MIKIKNALYFSHAIHSNLFNTIMRSYIAFGLKIQSEVLFRELLSTPSRVNDDYDITIKLGSVNPHDLNGLPPPKGVFYQVTSSECGFYVRFMDDWIIMV